MPMVFNSDVLFLHVPKTGGVSVTQYLLETLSPPIYYVRPQPMRRYERNGFVHIAGPSHYSIEAADGIVREHGFRVEAFPLILAVLRNPYDWAVSHYAYFRQLALAERRVGPLQELAR